MCCRGVLAREPAGMIQHEARVGSTLAANMIAVLPHTLVYSESEVPYQLVGGGVICSRPTL